VPPISIVGACGKARLQNQSSNFVIKLLFIWQILRIAFKMTIFEQGARFATSLPPE
jgi:type III secretory pathway component EscS